MSDCYRITAVAMRKRCRGTIVAISISLCHKNIYFNFCKNSPSFVHSIFLLRKRAFACSSANFEVFFSQNSCSFLCFKLTIQFIWFSLKVSHYLLNHFHFHYVNPICFIQTVLVVVVLVLTIKSNRWIDSITSLRQNVHRRRVKTNSSSHKFWCTEGLLIVDVHDATYTSIAVLKIFIHFIGCWTKLSINIVR